MNPQNKIYFSKIGNPEELPKITTIYCFHPKIAQFMAKLINRITKWFEKKK